jgi:hypothetical protein
MALQSPVKERSRLREHVWFEGLETLLNAFSGIGRAEEQIPRGWHDSCAVRAAGW